LLTQAIGCVRQHQQSILIKTMSVETELYLIDGTGLEQRVMPAIGDFLDYGDSLRQKSLSKKLYQANDFSYFSKWTGRQQNIFLREA
jgi:hypothetical protein